VQQRLQLSTEPKLSGIDTAASRNGQPLVLFSDLHMHSPHWWQAQLRFFDRSLDSVEVADPHVVIRLVGGIRQIAPFIVLNDLTARDDVIPREGCRAIFDAWFVFSPGILAGLDAAIAAAPTQTQADVDTIREGWLRYVAALRGT